MGHREGLASRAIARDPDHFAEERAATEGRLQSHLGFVDGAVIHLHPERCSLAHSLSGSTGDPDDGFHQGLSIGAVHVRDRTALLVLLSSPFPSAGAGSHLGSDRVRRIEVDEVEAHLRWKQVTGPPAVLVNEESFHSRIAFSSS